ncbi:hypothetical protein [Rhodospirillum centenum]|uniref:Uncharacterized protein n=1 Tax=Rhodospirillum centenum (strain ATCC 51521 / SW) TaxID=414684 RepID=B6INI0_RHOCS|nr:hypothetical protein [Rhodospirillum centenum]ACI99077.1 hypothetical protein RC1_1679 [Rhodospirillum centenum SW]
MPGSPASTASMSLILAQARPDRPPGRGAGGGGADQAADLPNLRLLEMGDALLGLDGRLVAAAMERYRDYGRDNPEHVRFMRLAGRGREVAHLETR